jgi:hypothetical protein
LFYVSYIIYTKEYGLELSGGNYNPVYPGFLLPIENLINIHKQGFTMRFNEFKVELNEVSMAPTSLAKMAGEIDATCGIEFEMYVPIEQAPGEMSEREDPRCRSINQVIDFFNDLDMGVDTNSMRDTLQEKYYEFLDNKRQEAWDDESEEYVRNYIEENWDEDSKYEEAYEDMGLDEDEISEAEDARSSRDKQAPGYDNYITAKERVEEMLQDDVDYSMQRHDSYYDNAREEWDNDYYDNNDESDFFEAERWHTMSDIADELGGGWDFEEEGFSKLDIDFLAEIMTDILGAEVVGCDSYHGCQGDKGKKYVVEFDSSLDNGGDEFKGVELVSPALPLEEMIAQIDNVKRMANKLNCFTDESTGLHMNISLNNVDLESIDYVKLVLFLGDKYVLDSFDRSTNAYCKSAMAHLESYMQSYSYGPNTMKLEVLELLQKSLSTIASRIIFQQLPSNRGSVNVAHISNMDLASRRIEFRSPGGDWISTDSKKLISTINRFVVALDIACDPSKHQREYAKKLYKLINPSHPRVGEAINIFTQYKAGEIDAATLKSSLQTLELRRSVKKEKEAPQAPHTGNQLWTVQLPPRNPLEINANSASAAIKAYRAQFKLNTVAYPDSAFTAVPANQAQNNPEIEKNISTNDQL